MSFKKRLVRYFQNKVGIGENRDRQAQLQEQLIFQATLMQRLMPDIFPLNSEEYELSEEIVEQYLPGMGSKVSTEIHKSDLMFMYPLLKKGGDMKATLEEYYTTGLELALSLKKIMTDHNLTKGKFLDFGSGYGRVSRHLKVILPDFIISVSEIKPEALLFQEKILGLRPVQHTNAPQDFPYRNYYNVVFAGSVFTHLPKPLFEAWLTTLRESLTAGGLLIFSIHNMETHPENPQSEFLFTEVSEDSLMPYVVGSLKDSKTYGVAYVQLKWLRSLLSVHGMVEVIPMAFGGTQDLVIFQNPLS